MKTDEIEKTEKTAGGDYLRMLTCYVIWGFQPLYFHLKPDIDGLFVGRAAWTAQGFVSLLRQARRSAGLN